MTIGHEYILTMVTIISALIILIVSIAIPVYGYKRKQFKGLAIGCLLQPVVCILFVLLAAVSVFLYQYLDIRQQKKTAMVTIRSIEQHDNHVDTLMWYVKDDEECLLDIGEKKKPDNDTVDVKKERKRIPLYFFDVIRLDATSVGVEDRMVVKFDLNAKKVTATDLDAPAEVVNVDWEKVKAYIEKGK